LVPKFKTNHRWSCVSSELSWVEVSRLFLDHGTRVEVSRTTFLASKCLETGAEVSQSVLMPKCLVAEVSGNPESFTVHPCLLSYRKAQYTPPTRRDSTVSSRRRRRCVLDISDAYFMGGAAACAGGVGHGPPKNLVGWATSTVHLTQPIIGLYVR